MTGWILCAPRWGDKERDKEMKWMTLCYPGNTAETDKWNFFPTCGKNLNSKQPCNPPGFERQDLQYEIGKLLIVNLDRDFPEKDFLELFGKYGSITGHKLCTDYLSGLRNGKAWITYKLNAEAEKALEALDGISLNKRSIEIKKSLKKGFVPNDSTNFTTK